MATVKYGTKKAADSAKEASKTHVAGGASQSYKAMEGALAALISKLNLPGLRQSGLTSTLGGLEQTNIKAIPKATEFMRRMLLDARRPLRGSEILEETGVRASAISQNVQKEILDRALTLKFLEKIK